MIASQSEENPRLLITIKKAALGSLLKLVLATAAFTVIMLVIVMMTVSTMYMAVC